MERALILAALLSASDDEAYRRILARDDAVMQLPAESWPQEANRRAQLRRVEADYRHFIAAHPQHAPAVTAYAGLLYDQGRHDEAVALWERALKIDPQFARAYNDLATHLGHTGHLAEAFRYHDKAIELEPKNPMFHFNWANLCILYRVDARQVYGWSEDEIFRRSLDAFRKARDLAPGQYEYATAYAESFYLWPKADWVEAQAAWEYCLARAPDERDRQFAYTHLARVCLKAGKLDEAQRWLAKVDRGDFQSLRQTLERRLGSSAAGLPGAGDHK